MFERWVARDGAVDAVTLPVNVAVLRVAAPLTVRVERVPIEVI